MSIMLAAALTVVVTSSRLTAGEGAAPGSGTGKASKPHIGSAMAVLATLEQARVLPPENTPEANRIIKSVIQFQSLFAKSDDPAVHAFVDRAMAARYGERGAELLTEFRAAGWTAPVLEALSDAEPDLAAEQRQALAGGFSRFNLSTNDFQRFMTLVREARQALATERLQFEQVYASHRRTMPGGGALR